MMMMMMMLFLSSLSSLSSSREVVEPYCYITSQHLIHSRFPPHRRFLTPGVAAVLAKKMDGVSDLCGIGMGFGAIRLQVHLLIYSLKQLKDPTGRSKLQSCFLWGTMRLKGSMCTQCFNCYQAFYQSIGPKSGKDASIQEIYPHSKKGIFAYSIGSLSTQVGFHVELTMLVWKTTVCLTESLWWLVGSSNQEGALLQPLAQNITKRIVHSCHMQNISV